MSDNKVWLISGCSTGIGRELVRAVRRRGERVVVTARAIATLDEFADDTECLIVPLDVNDPAQVKGAVALAEERFGRIDVLVNNAGYGYLAAVEEGEDEEVRAMFETNFFGLVSLTKTALPGMRQRRSGHIVNVTSMAGLIGFPGIGYYNATKFAVEGMSEALAKEVAPLGIKVTIVAPGPFRTDWAGRSLKTTQAPIADYAATAGARRNAIQSYSGKQPGDPLRAVAAIIAAVEAPQAPLHLVLGRVANDTVRGKLKDFAAELDRWRDLALATDFPEE